MGSADVLVIIAMAIPVATIALAVIGVLAWKGPWRIAAAIPLMLVVLWVLSLATSWPYEHTLWPLELLVYGLVCLVQMLVLRYAHVRSIRRSERSAS